MNGGLKISLFDRHEWTNEIHHQGIARLAANRAKKKEEKKERKSWHPQILRQQPLARERNVEETSISSVCPTVRCLEVEWSHNGNHPILGSQ